MTRCVLVTGGAGYVGSHVVRQLLRLDYRVVVIDDLSTGHVWAVEGASLIVADYGDPAALKQAFAHGPFDAVLHFAAHVSVPESLVEPGKYYWNNAVKSISLFEACVTHGVPSVILSSTAAVYGLTGSEPVDEGAPLRPTNPYGASKMMAERMLLDFSCTASLRYVVLRYFNVAGAELGGRLGQATPGSSALIKVVCEAAAGRRSQVAIHGTDYHTRDGTCIRDYIHIEDLASAHLAALNHLMGGNESVVLNCGYGRGVSVREIVEAGRRISRVDFPVVNGPRREGDVPVMVADATRIRALLGWRPAHDDLDMIIGSAWRWEQQQAACRATSQGAVAP